MSPQAIKAEVGNRRRANLAALLDPRGSKAKLASLMHTKSAYVSQMLSGYSPISDRTAARIESAFNLKAGWLDLPVVIVPPVDRATAEPPVIRELTPAIAKVKDLRKLNLRYIVNTRFGKSQTRFAHATGLAPGLVSRLMSDTPSTYKSMGERMARNIEFKLGLRPGALDSAYSEDVNAPIEREELRSIQREASLLMSEEDLRDLEALYWRLVQKGIQPDDVLTRLIMRGRA